MRSQERGGYNQFRGREGGWHSLRYALAACSLGSAYVQLPANELLQTQNL